MTLADDAVASRGGASAKEISDALELPLPTVYRLVRDERAARKGDGSRRGASRSTRLL